MKKLSLLILTSILIFSHILPANAITNKQEAVSVYIEPSTLSAQSAVLINALDNEIYFEKNANERLGMASTTKLMTALVVLDSLSPETVVKIPTEAVGIEGSSIYLVKGERLSVMELLHALLLSSANDAAVALAICSAGSIDAFVERMNEKAKSMGLVDTNFKNPHGLYDEEHYTTAYELALIGAEALRNKTIANIVAKRKATISLDGEEDKRLLINHNKLLLSYDGAIGMKTGFTKKTGRTLVSAAKRDDLTLIAVTLNAPSDWNDHRIMLDYGFKNYERVCLFPAGTFICTAPICDADKSEITLTNSEPIWMTRKKDDVIGSTTVKGYWHFALGSVKKGDIYGSVTFRCGDNYASSPLVYNENAVGKTKAKKGFFERILYFFSTD